MVADLRNLPAVGRKEKTVVRTAYNVLDFNDCKLFLKSSIECNFLIGIHRHLYPPVVDNFEPISFNIAVSTSSAVAHPQI